MTKTDHPFKECPCCRHQWRTREDFLQDPTLEAIGYQANFQDLQLGLFLFQHHRCGTCIGLYADDFRDLYTGAVFEETMRDGPDCPGHCLRESDLEPCPARCECAWVREVLQIIRRSLGSGAPLEKVG